MRSISEICKPITKEIEISDGVILVLKELQTADVVVLEKFIEEADEKIKPSNNYFLIHSFNNFCSGRGHGKS